MAIPKKKGALPASANYVYDEAASKWKAWDGLVTVGSVTVDSEFPAAAALSDSIANPTTTLVGANLLGWDSAASVWERLRTDGSGNLNVVLTGSSTVTAVGPLTDAQLRASAVPVSAASLPLPTGASTSANQTTIIGHLDGVEGLLTTIDADTSVLAGIDYATGADVASLGVTGGGVEAAALRVTVASDSTGVLSVDDNGGSLTVDGTVSVSGTVTVDSELTTADLDTGAGTDTRAVVGLVGTASGGGQLIPGSATDGLLVNLGANNDVTVTSGAITETNSAAMAASLSVLDDWDETNRAAVNLIVGQAGIAGGTGTDGATVPRVTLATNVALPAGTNAIGKLAANSGVDIGDVDVASIASGTNAIGRVGHDITGMGHGVTTVTTAGTDVALAGSTACKRVVIQAQTDNTSGIAVGATGVDATVATGNGIYLNPGDAFELEIDNLADVFIDSLVNGEGVRYTYFT